MFEKINAQIKKIQNHKNLRHYVTNFSWLFVEQMMRIVSGFFVGIWVARYLGPSEFGLFSYVIAFTAIFGSISKLGLDSIVVRDLVREPFKNDAYLGTAFWLKIVGSLLMLAVVGIVLQFVENSNTTKLYIFIIAIGGIFQSFEVVEFYFQSRVLSQFVSTCKLIQLMLSSVIKLYLIYSESALIGFVLVSLVDQITLAATLSAAYYLKHKKFFFQHFEISLAKKLLINSWPLLGSSLILMIQARVDQLIIKELVGSIELGYYSASLKLIEVFNFIPVIIVSTLYPSIIKSREISKVLFEEKLLNLYRLMMFLFIIISIPIYFYGNNLVSYLYGNDYTPANDLLILMLTRVFLVNYGVARGAFLITENLTKYTMLTMIIGALTSITLNMALIPMYGSKGAIYSSIFSFAISTFMIDLFYIKTRKNLLLIIISFVVININIKKMKRN